MLVSLKDDFDTALALAKRAIQNDELVVYPTDTLYGLGCNALSEKAVEKIYLAKERERGKPLSVLVASLAMAQQYCEISPSSLEILSEMLPGPYTFILPLKKGVSIPAAAGSKKIGIRFPDHFFMRTVSKVLNVPIVTTSANISGEKSASTVDEVDASIKNACTLIVDGGKTKYAEGSTVIDLVDKKILRHGAFATDFFSGKLAQFSDGGRV